ncbi:MAG: PIN domain-containing protein [Pseudonocardiaceae bacterium]|nr:PIN domain-containing protein [Pseudonocardiaceae bacterium]
MVVDASAMVDVLTGQPLRERLIEVLLDGQAALHAPALLDVEVVSAARRLELAGSVAAQRAGQLLDDFAEFGISRHPLPSLTARVWALRDWARVADAYYVSLAEALDAPLLTTDLRLARTVRDRDVVEVVDLDDR